MTNEERNQIAIDAMQFFKQKLNNGIYGEFVGNFDTAISALEKQIPKKVSVLEMPCETIYSCPNCHTVLPNEHSAIPRRKHCSNCGQALDF